MSEISHLPTEVIELIFGHLSYSDLGKAMQVCHKWCEVGCQPGMWREFQLVVNFKKNLKEIELCLESKRFSFVKRFKLVDNFVRQLSLMASDDRSVPESILSLHRGDESRRKKFQLIWQLPRLESLDLSEYNISSIDPDFLTDFPLNLKSLTMNGVKESNTGLTMWQTQELFAGLINQENLTELKISEDDVVWDVNKIIFGYVINKLENVELRINSGLRQLEALIEFMDSQDTKLRKLSMYGTCFSYIDAKKLSNAFNKVESLYLFDTMMSRGMLEVILKQIIEKTCLKSLQIIFFREDYEFAVEGIPEDLISEAGKKLDSFLLSSEL